MIDLTVYEIACMIMDDMNALNNGWSSYTEGLSYQDKIRVGRIVNNMIRQEYY